MKVPNTKLCHFEQICRDSVKMAMNTVPGDFHTRGVFFSTIVTIVLVIFGALYCTRQQEPSYAGRPLSEWVIEYQNSTWLHTNESEATTAQRHLAARDAIAHIGSNAAPFLLKWIRYEKPEWKVRMENFLNKIVGIFHMRRSQPKGYLPNASPEAFSAIAHSVGEDTIGELKRLVNDFGRVVPHKRAVLACSFLGPKGVPILMAAATNCPKMFQSSIINFMQNLGTNGRPAVPVIVKCLEKKARVKGDRMDVQILEDCVLALGAIRCEPEIAVPALIPLLEDSRGNIAVDAAIALGKYGPAARSAVPALLKRFNNPNCTYPSDTSNALWQIDPKSLDEPTPKSL